MKIESANISLDSTHFKTNSAIKTEKLKIWSSLPNAEIKQSNSTLPNKKDSHIEDLNFVNSYKSNKSIKPLNSEVEFNSSEDPEFTILKFIFENQFGVRLDLLTDKEIEEIKKAIDFSISLSEKYSATSASVQQSNWNLEFEQTTVTTESEEMNFSSSGVITTKDGREFSFMLKMNLSRKFTQEHNIQIKMGNNIQKDPLIINYDDDSAKLSSEKFDFDLDSDGINERMSFLNQGSGFLALDKNNDNIINNGSELFGAITGDGFKELSKYDEDSNLWIDENDPVYKDLKILTKDLNGADIINSIKSKSIGAIYLKASSTPFEYKTDLVSKNGESKSTGIFLKEDGEIGTVQQIDFVV